MDQAWKNRLKFILPASFILTLFLISFFIDFTALGQRLSVPEDVSFLTLTITSLIIGLLDGFNPCAMWVLIYLITLVSGLQDKKRMYFIVGTFLFASGAMYFAILVLWMAGWQFLDMLGFSKWVLIGVGGFAVWTGIYNLLDFYRKGGKIVCEVGDIQSRKRTRTKIQTIVSSPITILSFFAVLALAFAVNSIEFVCSAGLPAIFTQLLVVADPSVLAKYFYITLYVLAFMADDLLIFTLAMMALNTDVLERYSGLSKLLGGIVMLLIGIMLLFFPNLLF